MRGAFRAEFGKSVFEIKDRFLPSAKFHEDLTARLAVICAVRVFVEHGLNDRQGAGEVRLIRNRENHRHVVGNFRHVRRAFVRESEMLASKIETTALPGIEPERRGKDLPGFSARGG